MTQFKVIFGVEIVAFNMYVKLIFVAWENVTMNAIRHSLYAMET